MRKLTLYMQAIHREKLHVKVCCSEIPSEQSSPAREAPAYSRQALQGAMSMEIVSNGN